MIFIFRKENADQAALTIQAFPLILQAHFGPRSGNWLTDHAATESSEWTYDINTGAIKSKEDDYTAKILRGWDKDKAEDEDNSNNVHIILGENTANNQFDDNGTVLTMESELSGWSSASNDVPTVNRMLKKM